MNRGLPEWARRGQALWKHTGRERPPFAVEPAPGQESVWDYTRPPTLDHDRRRVEVRVGDTLIAATDDAIRVLETASPPTFYLPMRDVETQFLRPGHGSSFCEWKGAAGYWDVVVGDLVIENAGWSYPDPFDPYGDLEGAVAFYPAKLACTVDGQRVLPQPGGFYGGWVTSEIVGPFKGEPGTGGW